MVIVNPHQNYVIEKSHITGERPCDRVTIGSTSRPRYIVQSQDSSADASMSCIQCFHLHLYLSLKFRECINDGMLLYIFHFYRLLSIETLHVYQQKRRKNIVLVLSKFIHCCFTGRLEESKIFFFNKEFRVEGLFGLKHGKSCCPKQQ